MTSATAPHEANGTPATAYVPDAETAINLYRCRFLNRTDRVAYKPPWKDYSACPAEGGDNLDALLQTHILGEQSPPVTIRWGPTLAGNSGEEIGRWRIGSYSPALDGTTIYGIIDFDGGGHTSPLADPLGAALAVLDGCDKLGIPAYLERSGGGKGWHVWIFFVQPVPAADVRRLLFALLALAGDFLLANGARADARRNAGLEVFPKQDALAEGGTGNQVWLPWWHGAAEGGNLFYRVLPDGELAAYLPEDFDTLTPGGLARLLAEVAPPPNGSAHGIFKGTAWGMQDERGPPTVETLIHWALRRAQPGASNGRNRTGFDLACQLRDNGYAQAEAEAALLAYQAAAATGSHEYNVREALASLRSAYAQPPRQPWRRARAFPAGQGGAAAEAMRASDDLDRLPDVLAGGAAAFFADRPLLQALAHLAAADPAAFAARRATLKGLVSLRDLDAALKPLRCEQARERPPVLLSEAGYRIDAGRLCRERGTPDGGTALVPLCNFTAHITEAVIRDDGAEQTAFFTVAGALTSGQELPPVQVPAAEFAGLGWVTTAWYGEAVVYAGQGTRDHLRAAIELISTDRLRRTVYAHTGWRRIGDEWYYLHGAGAIGADGLAAGVEVSLPDPLAGFVLPAPPSGETLADAVRASLRMLRLGPDRVMFSLLAAVYRAALGDTDFGLHLSGPTGCFKSEVAALAQQHFGAGMDARHLPASWSSTGNALEGLAFAAKDALLVVDDFCPTGSVADVQRYHKEADRLLRGQGNRAGRQRMRTDATLRPSKPPRGLTLSTGEDTPRGQSLRARLLGFEISPGDFGPQPPDPNPTLSACQRDAADGKYAASLAGFICWLARQYEAIRGRMRDELAALRDLARGDEQHARTPGIVADLALGLRYFLDFAVAVGAISDAERAALWQRAWAALAETAADQAAHIAAAEPTSLFLRLLLGVLSSGRAHVRGPDGNEPGNPRAWGWRQEELTTRDGPDCRWRPQGRCIGWLDGGNLYLEPEAAYAEAQELARHQGDSLPVGARTLWRRMRDRNLLASREDRRQRNTVRRTLEGVKDREVLHLRAGALSSCSEPSEPSANASNPEIPAEMRTVSADGNGVCGGNRPQETFAKTKETPACGRFGRSDVGGEAGPWDDSEVV